MNVVPTFHGLERLSSWLEASRLDLQVEGALDKVASIASAAGSGTGKYPWTHPARQRRVIYHTPWYTRFVEQGRDEYWVGGSRGPQHRSMASGGRHYFRHPFHFVVNGKDIYSMKLGAITPRGDSMIHVQRVAEEALPRVMSETLTSYFSRN